ncbi:SDR family NAD(P)-dependent oxidoreductase [Thalassotalea nanhaiensis]|uniref:SDR family NAD(P)-dependent oxidoreductase n=1 Tax=Thalassotalea nanhaiensis TaxID=3065648 RepID=A0ABY9TJZ2_9GAMM|nr:SDR family NAD(P)-dependent oxidoreductase [Colwelliaceae bacterium SQ345]
MSYSTHYPSLKGKVIFITGGASGIGAEMVRSFVEQGAKVAFVDLDNNAAQHLSDDLHGNVWFQSIDATKQTDLQQSVKDAAEALGAINVLINNVANDMRHHVSEISEQQWHDCMKINLDPTFFASQAVYPYMQKNGGGSIVNFSSINAIVGLANMSGYVTAKAGIIGMTRAMAKDFGCDNIRVNAILPGWVATERQLQTWLNEDVENQWMESMAIKKRILASDVAKLALFLASDDSSMITGQKLVIDGGKI